MTTFALKKYEAACGKQEFHLLKKNEICEFEVFSNGIKGTRYETELKTITAYMALVANLQSLPPTKFKDITPKKEGVKEYEFKTKHLRVYVFHQPPHGKLIVCAGYKTSQPTDITHFRNLKREYLDSLKDC